MTPFRNTIIKGDCTKALPMLHDASVDFVLTDPPYVRNYRSDDGRAVRNDNNFAWLRPAFTEIYRVLGIFAYPREKVYFAAASCK